MTAAQKGSPEYKGHYNRGWAAGNRGSGLEAADARREPDDWYDGYMDAATGRPKWSLMHHDSAEEAEAALAAGWKPTSKTAANLPGGEGAGSAINTDLGQPNLPEASNIQTTPDMNGAGMGNGNPHDLTALPPVAPLEPMTTKPRQMPDGPQSPGGPGGPGMPGMDLPGADMGSSAPGTPPADPTAQDVGASTDLASTDSTGGGSEPKEAHRFVAVLSQVRRDNPGLGFKQATVLARRAVDYLRAVDDGLLIVSEEHGR